ncbi:MAG: hypothetical protein Q8Q54_13970 [Methylococcales bacterium]|nr:hypothetical protein [Methylococcales bacterium]
MAINITARYKIFLKWTLLVWLNAAFSFFLALGEHSQPVDIAGIICGVFTFVGIYTALDYYLIKIQAVKLGKSLFNTVLVKALTQFYPMIEIGTGMLSTGFIENIGLNNLPFISNYLTTLTDGILLSIVVALFMLIAKCIAFIIHRFKYKNTQPIDN